MALSVTALIDPGDIQAKEWHDQYCYYWGLGNPMARLYAWRFEPEVWVMAGWTLVFFCGGTVPSLGGWWDEVIAVATGAYWSYAYMKKPRVQRRYERLFRKRRALRVPKFLMRAVAVEAQRLGVEDWDEYPARRFALLRDTLAEASPWLTELNNDCGCKESCGHTNRLSRRVRADLQGRVNTTAKRKLKDVKQQHTAALEMNRRRHKHIRGALDATPEEDD